MKLLLVYFSSVHSNILVFQHQYFLHYYFSFPYSISFPTVTLRNLRLESPNRIMIGQLNVNSIRNKFEMLTSLIKNEIDILLLSETKIDETCLSDFHKLVVTILKMYLPNNQPKVITYRDYKNFDNSRFSEGLLSKINKLEQLNKNISIFHIVCIEVLEKYAPEKQKYTMANQANFMDKVKEVKSCYYVALKVT